MLDLTLIILCLNERDALPELLKQSVDVLESLGLSWEILVADGGSVDGTLEILSEIVSRNPRIHVRISPRPGYGRQLQDALNHSRGQRVAYIDGDGQYHPRDLTGLLDTPQNVLVSARRKGVASGWFRRCVTAGCARLARWLSGVEMGEVTAGYKVLPGGFARGLVLHWGRDFLASTEIVFQAVDKGLLIHSHPVSCSSRPAGRSKLLSLRGGCAVTADLLRLLSRRLFKPLFP